MNIDFFKWVLCAVKEKKKKKISESLLRRCMLQCISGTMQSLRCPRETNCNMRSKMLVIIIWVCKVKCFELVRNFMFCQLRLYTKYHPNLKSGPFHNVFKEIEEKDLWESYNWNNLLVSNILLYASSPFPNPPVWSNFPLLKDPSWTQMRQYPVEKTCHDHTDGRLHWKTCITRFG